LGLLVVVRPGGKRVEVGRGERVDVGGGESEQVGEQAEILVAA